MFKLSMFELDQLRERITDRICLDNNFSNSIGCDVCSHNCKGTCEFSRL